MKNLLFICLLLVTNSVWAKWVMVSQNSSSTMYIDPTKIRIDGDIRKVWQLKSLIERNEFSALSQRSLNEYDCKNERTRMLSSTSHFDRMATSDAFKSRYSENIHDEWHFIPPQTFEDEIFKRVCTK